MLLPVLAGAWVALDGELHMENYCHNGSHQCLAPEAEVHTTLSGGTSRVWFIC
jgi:hypothetical protein